MDHDSGTPDAGGATTGAAPADTASPYAWYVLFVLVLVYVLNFVDRQILSILANDIKADLGLTDSDLGFLYGTAFAVFYALFGLPLGRLADSWHRVRLMTTGLTIWSAMTALSGFSSSGAQLTAARIGVGVGEATASPSAYSLISDWFPKRMRATALAIYSSGLFIGGGISLFIGGLIVEKWNGAFPAGGPLGLVGWQAAFVAVGLPGLLLAVLVATLREPPRGQMDGIVTPPVERPFRGFVDELLAVIPPFTLIGAAARGTTGAGRIGAAAALALAAQLCWLGWAGLPQLQPLAALLGSTLAAMLLGIALAAGAALVGGRPIGWNLVAALGLTLLCAGLTAITRTGAQWLFLGIGYYAVFSWASSLRRRDPAMFHLIWGNPAFLCTILGYGMIAFYSYAMSYWAAPYAERMFAVPKSELGWWIGAPGALAGFVGVIGGGRIADLLRLRHPAGRVLLIIAGLLLSAPLIAASVMTRDATQFYFLHFCAGIFSSAALGAAAATSQDLVLPRMRGTATATTFLATTLVGLALGPYLAGLVSTASGELPGGEGLARGLLATLVAVPVGLVLLIAAFRLVPKAEATMIDRARLHGEIID